MNKRDVTPGAAFLTRPEKEFGKPVCRLGLASHGTTAITAEDVLHAAERGVNFVNWSGFAEGPPDDEAFPAAVAALGRDRDGIAVCVQFAARTAAEAAGELRSVLTAIHSDSPSHRHINCGRRLICWWLLARGWRCRCRAGARHPPA